MNIYDISHQISQLPLAHFLPKPVRHRVKPGRSSQKSLGEAIASAVSWESAGGFFFS